MDEIWGGITSAARDLKESVSTYEVRKLADKVQGVIMNYTEAEQLVREATNEEPWGPTGPLMQQVSQGTFQHDQYPEIMGMLWKRMLVDNRNCWRRVYKSLILLEHLLKHGAERVVSNAREHLFDLRSLEHYTCTNEQGKDEGINVRHRVQTLIEFLQDDDQLRQERRAAKKSREKYTGMSASDYHSGRSKFGGFSSSQSTHAGMSNIDNCDFDNDSRRFDRKRADSFDEPKGVYSDRGSTFAFPSEEQHSNNGHRRSPPPELGIEESPADWEFGDRSARVKKTMSQQKTRSPTPPTPTHTSKPVARAPPPTNKPAPAPVPVVDLLSLDDNSPPPDPTMASDAELCCGECSEPAVRCVRRTTG